MQDLSGQKILSRKRSGDSSDKKSASSDSTANRASRVHCQAKDDFTSASQSSLARHVDLAAVAKQSGKSTSGLQVDLSVHEPSRRVERLRAAAEEDRQSLTALDQNRFARLYSGSFASSKGASDLASCSPWDESSAGGLDRRRPRRRVFRRTISLRSSAAMHSLFESWSTAGERAQPRL